MKNENEIKTNYKKENPNLIDPSAFEWWCGLCLLWIWGEMGLVGLDSIWRGIEFKWNFGWILAHECLLPGGCPALVEGRVGNGACGLIACVLDAGRAKLCARPSSLPLLPWRSCVRTLVKALEEQFFLDFSWREHDIALLSKRTEQKIERYLALEWGSSFEPWWKHFGLFLLIFGP